MTLSRRNKVFLAFGGLVLLIFFFLNYSKPKETEQPPAKSDSKKPAVDLLPPIDLEKEHWRMTAEKEMMALKEGQKALKETIEELSRQSEEKQIRTIPLFPPQPQPTPLIGPSPQPSFPLPVGPAKPLELSERPGIRVFGPEARLLTGPGQPSGSAKPAKAESKEEKPYLPSGSFVKGILLSGLDAPAGARASAEPHPVLIRLEDRAVLPNRFRFDVKECFIVGEGYGDLSSERAYIRTTTLSCIRPDGTSIDSPVKGYVAGEDGKVGLRGRVVSKEGQLLAKAMVAGFAEGMAKVFSVSMTTVSVSPLGSTQSLEPGKAFQAGLLGGTSQALERLARYYIDMAERLFPVIEIDAGRTIDVVVLQGKPITPVNEGGGK